VVQVADELPEPHLRFQGHDAAVRLLHGRGVDEHQQRARDRLHEQQEDGRAAQPEGVGEADGAGVDPGGMQVQDEIVHDPLHAGAIFLRPGSTL